MSAAEADQTLEGWPCSTPACCNVALPSRRKVKLCADCAPEKKRPPSKRRCLAKGCKRAPFKDGMCPGCHPDGGPAAVVLGAVAAGKSPVKELAKHGFVLGEADAALASLLRADAAERIAVLMTKASFDPSKPFAVLGNLLDATKPVLTRQGEICRDADGQIVVMPDNEMRMAAVRLSQEVLSVVPVKGAAGPSVNIGGVFIAGAPPQALADTSSPPPRGVLLPPLKSFNPDTDEVIDVPAKSNDR